MSAPTTFESLQPRVLLSAALSSDRVLTLDGTIGDDAFSIEIDGPDVVVTEGTTVSRFRRITAIVADTGDGDDRVAIAGTIGVPARIDTGAGNDTIVGGNGDDVLWGGAGNDLIYARAGRDRLDYRPTIVPIDFRIALDDYGRSFDGTAVSRDESDTFYGIEYLGGSRRSDRFFVRETDVLHFGPRRARHFFGPAHRHQLAELHANAGDDLIAYEARVGAQIFGDDGNDFINVTANLANGFVEVHGGAGDDIVELPAATSDSPHGPVSSYLFGDDGNDRLHGTNGRDTIEGGAGVDQLHGYAGNDYIVEVDSTGVIYGGDGNDAIAGSGMIFGGNGHDTIYALPGGRDLYDGTSSGPTRIEGGAGDDVINARDRFRSRILGGPGFDSVITDGRDLLYDIEWSHIPK